MAEIVLGLAMSHSPQVSQEPKWWGEQAQIDRKRTPYGQLLLRKPQWIDAELHPDVWNTKYRAAQSAIANLAQALEDAAPDLVVLIGDDQEELFLDDCMPAFSVFWGKESWDRPDFIHGDMSVPSRASVLWAFHGDQPEAYPGHPDFGRHLIEHLIQQNFDVAQYTRQHEARSLGHAFTFVRRRIMRKDKIIPMIPVLINTYIPPNQPSPARCYALGQAIRIAIESWHGKERVAVIASGGLSHFVIDTELDRSVLEGLANGDRESLSALPRSKLQAGSSEILNWIAAGGALEGLRMELVDYIPGYRSEGGTGVGMAFAKWL
jgi:3-O-methylgallate 3,4-dioxygenase